MNREKSKKRKHFNVEEEANNFSAQFKKHVTYMQHYVKNQQAQNKINSADFETLAQHYQFVRDEEEDTKKFDQWQIRMSVKYYEKLFKEYALADLSRYKEGKIGLRWRTEQEVISGKGQFTCGNKKCQAQEGLHSYELLFAYKEQITSERKKCLVKVRACTKCAFKLFYKKILTMKKAKKKEKQREEKRRKKEDAQLEEDEDIEKYVEELKRESASSREKYASNSPTEYDDLLL